MPHACCDDVIDQICTDVGIVVNLTWYGEFQHQQKTKRTKTLIENQDANELITIVIVVDRWVASDDDIVNIHKFYFRYNCIIIIPFV